MAKKPPLDSGTGTATAKYETHQMAPPPYTLSDAAPGGIPPTSYPPSQYPPSQNLYPPTQYLAVQGQYPQTQTQYQQPAYPASSYAWAQSATQITRASAAASSWDNAENGGATFGDFSEKSIRLGFIRKVFAILAVMMLLTAAVMCIFMFVEEVKDWVQSNIWIYIAAIAVYLVAVFTLLCAGNLRRKTPYNFIFLGIISLAMGVMLGTIATYYDTREVLIAVGITFIITIGMCALGFQNKIDFTYMTGILFVATLCLIGFGLFAAILRSDILYIFYASIGAFIFSLWIVVDVQLMMGGKHKYSISPEEYITAALNLYLDIVNLLLYVLMIVGHVGN